MFTNPPFFGSEPAEQRIEYPADFLANPHEICYSLYKGPLKSVSKIASKNPFSSYARGLFHLQKAPSCRFAAIHPKNALHRIKDFAHCDERPKALPLETAIF